MDLVDLPGWLSVLGHYSQADRPARVCVRIGLYLLPLLFGWTFLVSGVLSIEDQLELDLVVLSLDLRSEVVSSGVSLGVEVFAGGLVSTGSAGGTIPVALDPHSEEQ